MAACAHASTLLPYAVELWLPDDTSAMQRTQAEARFAQALLENLGDAALVLPAYRAFVRIVQMHGEQPDVTRLGDAEREVYEYWRLAETAALTAAFGANRHMGEGLYEIKSAGNAA